MRYLVTIKRIVELEKHLYIEADNPIAAMEDAENNIEPNDQHINSWHKKETKPFVSKVVSVIEPHDIVECREKLGPVNDLVNGSNYFSAVEEKSTWKEIVEVADKFLKR